MNNYITVKKYSFWKENRISLVIIVLCLIASLYSFTTGSYGPASLNAFVVVLNVVFIYKNLPPKWARHTGATLLLNNGVSMQIVSRICGHSSTKITEQVYAKLLDETVVDAVSDIEDKL